MKILIKFFAIVLFLGLISCKKDTKSPEPAEEPLPVVVPTATTGSVKLVFTHMVDTLPLIFNQNFINAKGDTFLVNKLRYYISNIVITKNDNSIYVEPNSYHLIDHDFPATRTLNIVNLPFTSYKSISFMLGVDSTKSTAGAGTGDLSQANGMYWMWSSGYIMFKLEGYSPKSGSPTKFLEFHIGGYSGINKVQRNFDINISNTPAIVSSSVTPIINLSVNINEVFKTPNLIDFSTQFSIASTGSNAKMIADNYADMITLKSVQN